MGFWGELPGWPGRKLDFQTYMILYGTRRETYEGSGKWIDDNIYNINFNRKLIETLAEKIKVDSQNTTREVLQLIKKLTETPDVKKIKQKVIALRDSNVKMLGKSSGVGDVADNIITATNNIFMAQQFIMGDGEEREKLMEAKLDTLQAKINELKTNLEEVKAQVITLPNQQNIDFLASELKDLFKNIKIPAGGGGGGAVGGVIDLEPIKQKIEDLAGLISTVNNNVSRVDENQKTENYNMQTHITSEQTKLKEELTETINTIARGFEQLQALEVSLKQKITDEASKVKLDTIKQLDLYGKSTKDMLDVMQKDTETSLKQDAHILHEGTKSNIIGEVKAVHELTKSTLKHYLDERTEKNIIKQIDGYANGTRGIIRAYISANVVPNTNKINDMITTQQSIKEAIAAIPQPKELDIDNVERKLEEINNKTKSCDLGSVLGGLLPELNLTLGGSSEGGDTIKDEVNSTIKTLSI